MATATSTVPAIGAGRTLTGQDGFLAQVAGATVTAGRALARSWSLHRATLAVQSLDDATLADIGIRRSEAESVVRFGRRGAHLAPRPERIASAPLMGPSWTEWR